MSSEHEVVPPAADAAAPEAPVAPVEPAAEAAPEPAAEAAAEAAPAGPAVVVRASDYQSGRTFADFPISPEVLKGLEAMGYATATPVQAATIEPGVAGKDLIVRAKTGTGKTCAFCVPMVERIAAGDRRPRGIVLAPTRELALQVAQECAQIAAFKDVRICAIYGGVGFGPQEQALRDGVEIVVGTPGRILDHVRRGNLDLSGIQVAVLDEADEMLSMGFVEDVRKILDRCSKDRQTMVFSATLNEQVKGLIAKYQTRPEEVLLSYDGDNVSSVAHVLYETSPDYHKARALLDLLELERPSAAIIFCNTREDVSTVCNYLDRQGLNAEMISGELPQAKRERVMARVKAGATQFLVATDVAARGIDISELSHVVNYALPDDPSVYLHRIGRTGRIGKTGTAITLAGGADFSTRLSLERLHKITFEVKHLPTAEESTRLRVERVARTLKDASGSMAYESWLEIARQLKARGDADTLIAVALRAFFQWEAKRRQEMVDRDLAPEGGEGGEARTEERRDRGDRRDDRRDRGDRRDDRRDRGERRGDRREGDRGERREGDRGERREGDRGERREGDRGERREGERREGDRGERREGERREGDRGERRRDDRRDRREPRGERKPAGEAGAEGAPTPAAPPVDEVVPAAPVEAREEDETEEVDRPTGPAGEGDAKKRRRRRRRRGAGKGGSEGGGSEGGGSEGGGSEGGGSEGGGSEGGGSEGGGSDEG